MNIIEALRVYDVNSPKIRIGNERDGGYIVNELITNHSKKLISIGMGGEDTFERQWFEKYHTPIEAYDGTYPCGQLCNMYKEHVNKKIFYVHHNVGYEDKLIPLNSIVDGKADTLLKVDVEGAEYKIFDEVELHNVSGLILEVHDLHLQEHQNKLIDLIQNNFSELLLFHVHGNSWGNTFSLNLTGTGIRWLQVQNFPHVLELCFVNKKFVESYSLDRGTFPVHGLDVSNKADAPDVELHWINTL